MVILCGLPSVEKLTLYVLIKGVIFLSYTALYRKFRPTTFSEVVGQEHITKTLKNQIMADRIGHAYLFNGSRGTGKTSIAKIMARAVNCLNPKDGEPCNECEICKAALSGSLTDIVEMDAASNNSVEDIRAIRDEVNFLPAVAKYRVYIIDEVHMLSTGAFNALLKTLEEPPKHVKFILATTEPQKLPATILSRCQRFDFKRIGTEDIVKRLKIISKESNVNISDSALNMIAVLAEGALRDAISILERCIQDSNDELIDENIIRDLAGIPKLEYVSKISKALLEKDVNTILETSSMAINEGKDLDNFLWEIIKYIKDILVLKANGKLDLYTQDEINFIKQLAENSEKETLLRLIYNLSKLANDMKTSTQKSIIFEAGILKECLQEPMVIASATNINKPEAKKNIEIQPKPVNKEVKTNINRKTTNTVASSNLSFWNKVLDSLKQSGKMVLYANLLGTTAVEINDMTVEIRFNKKITDFTKKVLDEHENMELITKLVSMETGKVMHIKYAEGNSSDTKAKSKKDEIENIAEELDIPFNVIDE